MKARGGLCRLWLNVVGGGSSRAGDDDAGGCSDRGEPGQDEAASSDFLIMRISFICSKSDALQSGLDTRSRLSLVRTMRSGPTLTHLADVDAGPAPAASIGAPRE